MSEENTECCGTEIQSAGLEAVRRPIRFAAGWLMTLYARIHPECLRIMPSAKFVHTTTAHKHTQKRHRLCGREMLSSVTSTC